jgi:hypothetical protein
MTPTSSLRGRDAGGEGAVSYGVRRSIAYLEPGSRLANCFVSVATPTALLPPPDEQIGALVDIGTELSHQATLSRFGGSGEGSCSQPDRSPLIGRSRRIGRVCY